MPSAASFAAWAAASAAAANFSSSGLAAAAFCSLVGSLLSCALCPLRLSTWRPCCTPSVPYHHRRSSCSTGTAMRRRVRVQLAFTHSPKILVLVGSRRIYSSLTISSQVTMVRFAAMAMSISWNSSPSIMQVPSRCLLNMDDGTVQLRNRNS